MNSEACYSIRYNDYKVARDKTEAADAEGNPGGGGLPASGRYILRDLADTISKTTARRCAMEISKQEYQKFVQDRAKSSPIVKNCALAFVIGGGICVLGQAVMDGWTALGLEKTDAGTATSICLVFLSVLLTGMNLYNKLGRYGGAGTLVPITGFANAVASPAIDFKTEGMVTGMAAKMFTVAGPVIVFGVTASVAYGVILMVLQMLP